MCQDSLRLSNYVTSHTCISRLHCAALTDTSITLTYFRYLGQEIKGAFLLSFM